MNKFIVTHLVWLAASFLMLTGCITYELQERIKSDSTYTELVSHVLVSEDGEYLVFIGDDYHYIFDLPVGILNSLESEFRRTLFASFKEFRVDLKGKMTGLISISLDESASQTDKQEALRIGYENISGNPVMEVLLEGKRYKAIDFTADNAGYKLNYTYKVTVREERTSAEKAALTAATPITILADGVLAIVGVPLVVLLQISPN